MFAYICDIFPCKFVCVCVRYCYICARVYLRKLVQFVFVSNGVPITSVLRFHTFLNMIAYLRYNNVFTTCVIIKILFQTTTLQSKCDTQTYIQWRNQIFIRPNPLCFIITQTLLKQHWKASFEKNCFFAWASTLNMDFINKGWYGMFVACGIWNLANFSSVSPSSDMSEQTLGCWNKTIHITT